MDGTLQKLTQSLDDLIRKPSKHNHGGAGGRGSAAKIHFASRGGSSTDPGRGTATGVGQPATQAAVSTTQPRKHSIRPDLRQPERSQQQSWQQPAKKRAAMDVAPAADIPLEKKLNLSLDELAKAAAAKRAPAAADAGQYQPHASGRGGPGQAARGARMAAGRGSGPRAGRGSTPRIQQSEISMHPKYELINGPSATTSSRGRGRGGGRPGRMPGRGGYGSTTRYTTAGGASHAPINYPYGLQDEQYDEYGEDEYEDVEAEYDVYDDQEDEYEDEAAEADFGDDRNEQGTGAGYGTNRYDNAYKQGRAAATAAADAPGDSGEGYGPQRRSQPGLTSDLPSGTHPVRKLASYYSSFPVPDPVVGGAASFFRNRMTQLLRTTRDATGRLPLPPQFLPSTTPHTKKRPSTDTKVTKDREDARRKAEELRLAAESARAIASERAAGVARAREVLWRLKQVQTELGGSAEAQAAGDASGARTAPQQPGLGRGGRSQRLEEPGSSTRGPQATSGGTRAGHDGRGDAPAGEEMATQSRGRTSPVPAPSHPQPYGNSHPNSHIHPHPPVQSRAGPQHPPQGGGWAAGNTVPEAQDSFASKPAAHSMQGEIRGAQRDVPAVPRGTVPARPSPQTRPGGPASEAAAGHERREHRGRSPTRERFSESPSGAHRERGVARRPVGQSREYHRARSVSRGTSGRHWEERRVGTSRSRSRSRSRSPVLPPPPPGAAAGELHPHARYQSGAASRPQDAFEGRDLRHSRTGYGPEGEWRQSGYDGPAPRRGAGGDGWGPSQADSGPPLQPHPYDWPETSTLHPHLDPGDYHQARTRPPHRHPGASPAGGSFYNSIGSEAVTHSYGTPPKGWQPGPAPYPPLVATASDQPPPDRERYKHSVPPRAPDRRDPGSYRGLSPEGRERDGGGRDRYPADRGPGRERDMGPANRDRHLERQQMDRDRERDANREREQKREGERERMLAREPEREREAGRELELARQRERERERDVARQRERELWRERDRDRQYMDREQRSSGGPQREMARRYDRPDVVPPSRRDDVRVRVDDARDEPFRRQPMDGGRGGAPDRDSTGRVTGVAGGVGTAGGSSRGQDPRLLSSRRPHSPDRSRCRNDSESRRAADREPVQQQQLDGGGGGTSGAGTAGDRGREGGVVRERSRSPQASAHRGRGGGEREVGSAGRAVGAGSGDGGRRETAKTETGEAAAWNNVYVEDVNGGGDGREEEEEEDAVRRGHSDASDGDKQDEEEEDEEGQAAVSEAHHETEVYEEEIVDYDLPDELDID